MKFIKYLKIYIYLLIVLMSLAWCDKVLANVTTEHSVTYTVEDTLSTKVEHTLVLNYDDKYTGIERITIDEPTNNITELTKPVTKRFYTVSTENNKVIIKFNELIVGPTKLNISYSYSTKGIFKKVGTLYSVEVPKVTGSEISKYDLKIYIPKSLPLNEYTNKVKTDETGNYLSFTKKELEQTGKFLNFGKEIFYELSVKHLISAEKNYIVIPPTIPNRQEVYIESVSKDPAKIYKDRDDNLIFEYDKNDNTESINATYLIKIFGNAYDDKVIDYKRFLQPVKNWNYKKGLPLEITKKIIDSNNAVERAFFMTTSALEYNINSVSYDTNLRIGAENINDSNSKNAVCLEYSDLLIAILRGIGVPAREINGLNYKNDIKYFADPELHSWLEYYDNETWKQVDPTFSDTSEEDYFNSFDLYHIAFLRRSENSEYPLLTGSYSSNNIREQIKINTVNTPSKTNIKLKYFKIFLGYFVINDSYSYIDKLAPKSATVVSSKDFDTIKKFSNNFFSVTLEKANINEIINSQKNYFFIILISSIVSICMFIFAHKKLLKKTNHKKDKVSRIV